MERAPALNLPERRPQNSESSPEDSESVPEHDPPSFPSTSPSVRDTSPSSFEFSPSFSEFSPSFGGTSPSFSEFSPSFFLGGGTREPHFQKTGFGGPVVQGHRDRCPSLWQRGTTVPVALANGPRCIQIADANLARFRGAREPRLQKTGFGSPVVQGYRDRCPVGPTNGTMARLARRAAPG